MKPIADENDWLACEEPSAMLECIQGKASARKLLLFQTACCRRVGHLLGDPRARKALRAVEEFADDRTPGSLVSVRDDLKAAVWDAFSERYGAEAQANFCDHPAYSHAQAVEGAVNAVGGLYETAAADPTVLQDMKRDRTIHQHAALAAACYVEAFALCGYLASTAATNRLSYKVVGMVSRRVCWAEEEAQCHLLRDIFGNPFAPVTFSPIWRSSICVSIARSMYETRDFSGTAILADALQDAGCEDEQVLGHLRGPGPHVRGCAVVDSLLGLS